MKTRRVIRMLVMLALISGWTMLQGQDNRLEVPGDHFSLEGALELFKKSGSPEEFEWMLNSSSTEINNLDLNGDGDIDYIKVIDRYEGNIHAFILQAVVSPTEQQDVAVIELEKLANGKAVLQITGDADIYGIETIIEPTEEVRINAGTSTSRTVVNVWTWPSVQYVYSPYYYGWISPWDWNYRPMWWSPWRPVTYISYYTRWEPYRPYYSVCHTHRVVYAQRIYQPYRSASVVVYNRHQTQITNYRSSRQYSSDLNRGRDNDRYDRRTSYRGNDDRQSSFDNDRKNSRTIPNGWRQPSDLNRNGSSSGNRTKEPTRTSSEWNQSSTQTNWRQNPEKKQGFENREIRTPKTNESLFEKNDNHDNNRSISGWQRNSNNDQKQASERRQNFGSQDAGARQREIRPSHDSRSVQQRTVVQPDRNRSSAGNADMHRSGSNSGGNKSGVQKRGRD